MPKNAHPPRGGQTKKPKSVPPEEDTSFIVFGNGKEKKSKKADASSKPADDKSNAKGKTAAGPSEEGPKRPDTRTLIGGASWTGKLPVNLLSEHFQKQKWAKPDYRLRRQGEKHLAQSVVLSKVNPKTQETTTLPPIEIPKELESEARHPTAVEARNFAAAYALFRVASAKNMHMMMPPSYRDLWKGIFTDMKKADERNGKAWMYEPDPFFAYQERQKAEAAAAKEREKKQKEREDAKKTQNLQPGMSLPNSRGPSPGRNNLLKGWERVPKIELGEKTRKEAERLIRRDALWNPHDVPMDPRQRSRILDEVTDLGFRRSHVEEAINVCKDREEVIEWLLIHVPEDDLPSWSLPEGYVAGISMASSDLKREGAIKRLAAAGYASELCEEAFDNQCRDEGKAAAYLQARLLRPTEDEKDVAQELASLTISNDDPEGGDAWEEEQMSLEAIYGDLYERPSPTVCRIQLDIKQQGKRLVLQARKPVGPYPSVLPIITFEAGIPSYIRLSIIRQALLHAETSFIGAPMIFDIVDWVQQNAGAIFKDPGRLTDVSSGASVKERQHLEEQAHKKGRKSRARQPIRWDIGSQISRKILSDWQIKQGTEAQKKMMTARQGLPAWKLREEIVRAVNDSQVCIISGETGSGKSTQSVQFVLDDLIQRQLGGVANIICTQPRRISALGLADRVADERCAQVGEEIGYAIRGESKQKPGTTKITFVTTGVLLRRLQTSGGSADDVVAALADVSHVVVDEVHERSLDTDFLLVLLRDILRKRKDLKVILMSATLDADVFEAYFHDVGPVGRVEIQGRTYPVDDYYVDDIVHFTNFRGGRNEDFDDTPDTKSLSANLRSIGFGINYDLIAETVRYIDQQLGDKDGGVLIFLPGTMEIDRTLQALRQFPNFHALPLHASLLPAEQKRVFPRAPAGKRKVIAATNVAETSITIEDIVAVIDTGKVKETSFDPQNNMVRLAETWASRAACKQRRGRAGRVRAGQCYKLYTRNAEAKMMERPDPEIRRVPLEQLCLSIKAMGVQDVSGFLASALTPPESTAVEGAIKLLGQIGAIDDDQLTALGRHLSMIPADLRCSKLLVFGATFGCLEATLTIASVLTTRSPFLSPRERDQETRDEFSRVRSSFSQNQGDLLIDLRAYEQWSGMRAKGVPNWELRRWCQDNRLSSQTLFDVASNRSQYLSSLKEISLIPTSYSSNNTNTYGAYNKHNANDALLRALIAGSFNPQIARIQMPDKKFAAGIAGAVELDPEARTIKYFNQENGRVFVHPSSIIFDAQTFPSNAAFIAYFNKMATSKIFIRDITPFNAYSLLMFAGSISVDTLGRGLVVDEWIRLRGWARIGVLVSRLRGMLDAVLDKKVREPGKDMDDMDREVVDCVRRLVEKDGLDN
ncbi:DEAD/DEAH box helicase-like protein [Aaosphaeria arxii CBS 175.79]|uniref:RNA helicase n=1 Tax=Aaosphaeria arxii CBS 175.79 TaxID=1450172 RepID=A0A6A5XFC8_9PLEO|nr:DEAD/DEAH box helicase-like protein [Aaosphaeria arxii CBS 175.79]KAF2011569.1 DEAD/DEAH box helicase-like protein [Aaosphaeria arxii CBS 175.79]